MLRRKRAELRLPLALMAVWVCLALASLSPGAEPPSFNGARAFEDLKHLVDFGPRPSGSPALTQTRQWIIQELRGTGASVEEDPFVGDTPIGPIPMNNLIAKFRRLASRDGDRGRPLRYQTFRQIPFFGRQ